MTHRSRESRPPPTRTKRSSLDILYEDDHLLAVNKPAGLHTRSARSDSRRSLHDAVLDHIRGGDDGSQRVRPINHLDSRVSGVALFAKSKRMESALEALFRAGGAKRIYSAIVEGRFEETDGATGTIQTSPDARGPRPRHTSEAPPQRPAVTHYRLERQTHQVALLKLKPESHRKDQMLEHTRKIGHPIVGDDQSSRRDTTTRLMLHLESLSFPHPRTGTELRITAPMPDAFAGLLGEQTPQSSQPKSREAAATSWDQVADWYGRYQASERSDHFARTIHPGMLGLLGDVNQRRVLDVACGEGTFAEMLTARGATVVGIDAAPDLIAIAKDRRIDRASFMTADAASLAEVSGPEFSERFDAACCVMALMNIGPLAATLSGIASRLRDGAPFAAAILHPAFRAPGRTSWEWRSDADGRQHQFRRVDAYLSESTEPITMNPGAAARGEKPVITYTFLRPISAYVNALAAAGFAVDAIEEWTSSRTSEPGPRAEEENRARSEIPLFLGIRARLIGRTRRS